MVQRPPPAEVAASTLRARLRGLADARGAREGSGYRVTAGAGYSQVSTSAGVAAYRLTRGYVVAWCSGALEGAGWYFVADDAREGFEYMLGLVRTDAADDLAALQAPLTVTSDPV